MTGAQRCCLQACLNAYGGTIQWRRHNIRAATVQALLAKDLIEYHIAADLLEPAAVCTNPLGEIEEVRPAKVLIHHAVRLTPKGWLAARQAGLQLGGVGRCRRAR